LTSTYRLPWRDGTTVYELDQPEVIDFKTQTLTGLGETPKADRRTVIDLRNDWPKALLDNGFDPTQPTAWIAEGLLIYLPPEAQDLLFDRINELSAAGSRVATEHIPDVSMFSDERSQQITDRLKKYGHDIEMKDLIYHGERSHRVLLQPQLRPRGETLAQSGRLSSNRLPSRSWNQTNSLFALRRTSPTSTPRSISTRRAGSRSPCTTTTTYVLRSLSSRTRA
jgi:O-methyltransferase involved in polyketide biosynthesis